MANATRLVGPLRSSLHAFGAENTQSHYVCRICRSSLLRRRIDGTRSFASAQRQQADTTNTGELDDGYVPAENWDGLEWIGSKDWLYAREARSVHHKPFGASRALTWEDREEITACLRRAVVELLAVSKAGKPPLSLSTAPAASDDAIDYTLDVNVNVSNNGQDGALSFQGEDSRRAFCEGLGIEDSSAGRIAADEADGAQTESWQALALDNPELKFAILKRVQQLSGLRLPDTVINASSTPRAILDALTRKPKPSSVLQVLQEDARLGDVDNVVVHGQRQSRFHQDKALGRWKTIERELRKYELPIPGERLAR